MTTLALTLLLQAGTLTTAQIPAEPGAAPRPDMVLRWNAVALNAIRAEKTPPPLAARNLAIVHVAIFDAVNAVARNYRPYAVDASPEPGASPAAAAAAAAHRTLVALYPGGQRTSIAPWPKAWPSCRQTMDAKPARTWDASSPSGFFELRRDDGAARAGGLPAQTGAGRLGADAAAPARAALSAVGRRHAVRDQARHAVQGARPAGPQQRRLYRRLP